MNSNELKHILELHDKSQREFFIQILEQIVASQDKIHNLLSTSLQGIQLSVSTQTEAINTLIAAVRDVDIKQHNLINDLMTVTENQNNILNTLSDVKTQLDHVAFYTKVTGNYDSPRA